MDVIAIWVVVSFDFTRFLYFSMKHEGAMDKRTLTRRRFTLAAGGLAVAGLAGCTDDDDEPEEDDADADDGEDDADADDDGDDDEIDIDDEDDDAELIIQLENEDGEPVSTGVMIAVEELDGVTTHNISEEIEDGEARVPNLDEGDLLITVESTEDEFEPVEEEVTFEGEDEEVEFVLEGATPDGEADDEDEAEEEEED